MEWPKDVVAVHVCTSVLTPGRFLSSATLVRNGWTLEVTGKGSSCKEALEDALTKAKNYGV